MSGLYVSIVAKTWMLPVGVKRDYSKMMRKMIGYPRPIGYSRRCPANLTCVYTRRERYGATVCEDGEVTEVDIVRGAPSEIADTGGEVLLVLLCL